MRNKESMKTKEDFKTDGATHCDYFVKLMIVVYFVEKP
jgi:hypothetical protein